MKKKPARGFAITAGLITALMLSTLSHRNDAFEFCTTRAFGFPFPWRVEWCLCEPPAGPGSLRSPLHM